MAQMGAQSIVNSIALSIGSAKLAPLYDEMLASDQSLSFKLVDTCIKLNYFKSVPEAEISEIYDEVKEKHFTSTLLKMMVINSLVRYPPSVSKQQSIFSKLGISMKNNPQFLADIAKKRSQAKAKKPTRSRGYTIVGLVLFCRKGRGMISGIALERCGAN